MENYNTLVFSGNFFKTIFAMLIMIITVAATGIKKTGTKSKKNSGP